MTPNKDWLATAIVVVEKVVWVTAGGKKGADAE